MPGVINLDEFAEYPYYIEFGYQGQAHREQNIQWLTRTFGSDASWRASVYDGGYYFRREQDLTLFRLWHHETS